MNNPTGLKLSEKWPEAPGDSVVDRLQHTVDAFPEEPDEWVVVRATHGHYGSGVVTGLTLGDLRRLSQLLREKGQGKEDPE